MGMGGAETSDVLTVQLETDGNRLNAGDSEAFLETEFNEGSPAFSPDGRWVAYTSNESGRNEVSVRPYPPSGSAARFPISNAGGSYPVWSKDSDELYYRSMNGEIMVVDYTVDGDRFTASRPRVWSVLNGATFWDIGPDGRALIEVPVAADAPADDSPAPPGQGNHHIVVLQNFFDYLNRVLPLD